MTITEEVNEKKEELKAAAHDIISDVQAAADTFLKLTSIKATQKASTISSSLIVAITLAVAALFVIGFAGLGLSWWLGNLVENRVAGFFLGSLFFLLIMGGVYLGRKSLMNFLRDLIVRKIYD